jgi:hypothetical protein
MNTNSPTSSDTPVHFDIRHLSVEDLARLGVSQIAYVKPVMMHAADGTPMAVTGNREVAISAIIQHEMLPTLVH